MDLVHRPIRLAEGLTCRRRGQALQDAGCFAVVLECLPPVVAAAATSQLDIPTIGIGAGPHCSGQARRAQDGGFWFTWSLALLVYSYACRRHGQGASPGAQQHTHHAGRACDWPVTQHALGLRHIPNKTRHCPTS